MSADLAAALKLDRDVRLRAAPEVLELPGGFVVRYPDLPDVYDLNCVVLEAPLAAGLDAAALLELAERWLSELGHRQLVIEDSEAGERLAPELIDHGWERRRTVFMVMRGGPGRADPGRAESGQADPGAADRDPRVRDISDAELQAVQRAAMSEEDFGPGSAPDLVSQLVAVQAAMRAGTPARGFGAGSDGELRSTCTLFMDPDSGGRRAAMVEHVWTLRADREQGLATAVVSSAIRAARDWGAELLVIPADADDWPQLLYSKLGFEPVGTTVTLTRRGGSGSGAV